ncbi:MAG: DnaJ domain-containing protein [Bacteroidetes bacterium]|nr:DnaJ domain-containing protein [Bacteroidota bacterium]
MAKHPFQSLLQMVHGAGDEDSGRQSTRTRERDKEIKNAMLVLAAAVIRCDKNFTSETEQYIERYWEQHWDTSARQVGRVVAGHVETGTEPFTKMACSVLKLLITYPSALSVLNFLLEVAAADDFVNPKEMRCIHRIAKYLGVNEADFKALQEDFMSRSNPYAVLGLNEDASPEEVKAAYRKLTLKYHPDKQTHAAQHEAQKQKFLAVRRAYELLQKRQG